MTLDRAIWVRGLLGLVCLVLALAITVTRARAECSTDGAQYSTDFSDSDGSWGSDPRVVIGGGQMLVTEPPGGTDSVFYSLDTFGAGTICADFKLTGNSDAGAAAGIAFWGASADDYYTFVIDPVARTFAVQRRLGGTLSTPLAWQSSGAIGNDPDALNELAVEYSGDRAMFYINNREVDELTGFAPDSASAIGLRGDGGSKLGAIWSVTNLVVRT